jgi:hypothetical protein
VARGVAPARLQVGGGHVRYEEEEDSHPEEGPPRVQAFYKKGLEAGEEEQEKRGVPDGVDPVYAQLGLEGGGEAQKAQGQEGQGEPGGPARDPEEGQGEGGVADEVGKLQVKPPGEAPEVLKGPKKVPQTKEEEAQAEAQRPPPEEVGPASHGHQGREEALAPGGGGGE